MLCVQAQAGFLRVAPVIGDQIEIDRCLGKGRSLGAARCCR